MKPKVAIVRGAFLNRYEMQFFEPLVDLYDITAFSSRRPFHDHFAFPIQKLLCPMDLPEFPFKMPILNRLFTDAHYLWGLEGKLSGFDLVHTAETYFRYTNQALNAKRDGRVKHVIATVLENIPFNNEGIAGRTELKARARDELDHIIALTARTKTALVLEGADEKKITVISHFIDTKRFTPKKGFDELHQGKTISILFCGRLEKYKGIYELVYAAKLLHDDSEVSPYDITYTFIGGGSEKKALLDLERRLKLSNRIHHLDATYDAMPEHYHNADIYVAPSKETETWQEQYNTTLLEAQASGLPIITTRSGGIEENVGDAALFVQPGDVLSLYGELKRLILHPEIREQYAKKARNRAVKVHDVTIGARKIAQLYDYILSK